MNLITQTQAEPVTPPPRRRYVDEPIVQPTVAMQQPSIVCDSPSAQENQDKHLQESAKAWKKVLTYSNVSTPSGVKVKSHQRRRIGSSAKPAARRKPTRTKKGASPDKKVSTSSNNALVGYDRQYAGALANQELFALSKRFKASFNNIKKKTDS